jgi:uncharacterized HAD superfamily protein
LNTQRRIYVDFDDVLSETGRAHIKMLKQHYDKTVRFDEISSFDLGVSFGLTDREHEEFMRLAHEPKVLSALRPIDGAVQGLEQFMAMGYRIAVVTGRPSTSAEVSRAWLDDHGVPYHQLTFVDKYGRGSRNDGYANAITLGELGRMSFCFAVEDSAETTAFLTESMALPVALFERPWNRAHRFSSPRARRLVARCADWSEIVDRFRNCFPY